MPLHFRQCLTTNLYCKPPDFIFHLFVFLVWDLALFLSSAYFFLSCTEFWNVNKRELQTFFFCLFCFSDRYNKENVLADHIKWNVLLFIEWICQQLAVIGPNLRSRDKNIHHHQIKDVNKLVMQENTQLFWELWAPAIQGTAVLLGSLQPGFWGCHTGEMSFIARWSITSSSGVLIRDISPFGKYILVPWSISFVAQSTAARMHSHFQMKLIWKLCAFTLATVRSVCVQWCCSSMQDSG